MGMPIEIHAIYRAGAIYPDQPLGLPENTEVKVVIVPVEKASASDAEDDVAAIRPKSPKITSEEFRALIAKHAVRVGSLPPDFSREDIYSDHD
jgi:predicted DNA-binding antitoxin AbrB/MazE fold protein